MSKTCPACGTGNRPIARFCKQCATPLEPAAAADGAGARADAAAPTPAAPQLACTGCGAPNRAVARFCRRCGLAMAGEAQATVAPLLRQPDRLTPAAHGPAHAGPAPAGVPRRRPIWQLLFLVGVLGAALFWWQRGSAPPPAPTGPVEEFLGAPPSPASSQPPASTEPAAEPSAPPASPAPSASSAAGAATHQDQDAAATAAPARAQRLATRPAAPAPAPAVASGPDAACADSNRFTHSVCLGIQCLKAEFRRHPTCVRLDNEARERRQRESDHGLVGG